MGDRPAILPAPGKSLALLGVVRELNVGPHVHGQPRSVLQLPLTFRASKHRLQERLRPCLSNPFSTCLLKGKLTKGKAPPKGGTLPLANFSPLQPLVGCPSRAGRKILYFRSRRQKISSLFPVVGEFARGPMREWCLDYYVQCSPNYGVRNEKGPTAPGQSLTICSLLSSCRRCQRDDVTCPFTPGSSPGRD